MNQLQTDLAALRSWIDAEIAKADAATAEPWEWRQGGHNRTGVRQIYAGDNYVAHVTPRENATFIASARTTCPLALDMMLLALDGLEVILNHSPDGTWQWMKAEETLESMISAWKEETK